MLSSFPNETPLFVETENLLGFSSQFLMCDNEEDRMPQRVSRGNNHAHTVNSVILPCIGREIEQGSNRIRNVEQEETDHQSHGTQVSLHLGIPKAGSVSLHPLYVSSQGMYQQGRTGHIEHKL